MARTVKRKLSEFVSFLASFLIVWLGGSHSIARSAYDTQSGRRDAFPTPHVSAAGTPTAADPLLVREPTSVSTDKEFHVAQYGGEGRGPTSFGPADLSGYGLSQSATAAVSDVIANVAVGCEDLPVEYRIDCLGKGLTLLARKVVPARGDYREMKHELRRAGNRLRSIARQNRDRAKPVIAHIQTTGRGGSSARRIRPIKQEALQQATEEAIGVIREAQTRLLRSDEGSQRRRVHYQAVSRSLDSAIRILRS